MAIRTNTAEQAIRIHVENWSRAVREKDLDGILANHAPDLVLFDVPAPIQWRGIDDYRKSWEMFFGWSSGEFEIDELSVTAGDDVAFCHGLIRCAGADELGRREVLTVRLTIGLKRIDDRWVVLHEHHSEPSLAKKG
jgi:uncharacterized protein (TIGR02246 family)